MDKKTGNPYIDNANKGFELIRQIFSSGEADVSFSSVAVRDIIWKRLLPLLAEADIEGELEMVRTLQKDAAKFNGSLALEKLKTKAIVGIGGRFSSGKSRFINSLMGKNAAILPVGQTPTTSISTYISKGEQRTNIVSSMSGADILLDDDAVIALNHQFYEKYGIGFSSYIRNIVLETPLFQYEHIALLDTPGYNKADSAKKQEASDREKARTQLRNVDYIIWVIDEVLKEGDLDFLSELEPSYPPLFVVNKADKVPESLLEQRIEGVMEALDNSGIEYCDVVGYSSFDAKEILSEGLIETYLQEADEAAAGSSGVTNQILDICQDIKRQLDEQKTDLSAHASLYRDLLRDSTDLFHIKSVLDSYNTDNMAIRTLERMSAELDAVIQDITDIMNIQQDSFCLPEDGDYQIIPASGDDFALNAEDTLIQLCEQNDTDAQVFTLVRHSGPWYHILHKRTGLAVSVSDNDARLLLLTPSDNCCFRFLTTDEGLIIQQKGTDNVIALDAECCTKWYLVPVQPELLSNAP